MRTRSALSVAVLAISLLGPAAQDAARAAVRVDYDPPALSVEATDADLIEVLNAIGAKVGFTVSQSRTLPTPVSISVESASVEDVLRRLLRSENHTILYRQGTDSAVEVDRIVLLGQPGEGGPAPESVIARAPAQARGTEPVPGTLAPPVAARTAAPATGLPAPAVEPSVPSAGSPASATGSEESLTVGDMLRSHALAGVPPQASSEAAVESPRLPASLEETLAITTRRAQQGLTSLVEGLEKATQALQQQSTAAPAR
jgi:hypothetical protein